MKEKKLEEHCVLSIARVLDHFHFMPNLFFSFSPLLLPNFPPSLDLAPRAEKCIMQFPDRKPTNRRTSKPTFVRFLFFLVFFWQMSNSLALVGGKSFLFARVGTKKQFQMQKTESVRFFESPLEHVSVFRRKKSEKRNAA